MIDQDEAFPYAGQLSIGDVMASLSERRAWYQADGQADRGRGIIMCAICDSPLRDHTTFTHGLMLPNPEPRLMGRTRA